MTLKWFLNNFFLIVVGLYLLSMLYLCEYEYLRWKAIYLPIGFTVLSVLVYILCKKYANNKIQIILFTFISLIAILLLCVSTYYSKTAYISIIALRNYKIKFPIIVFGVKNSEPLSCKRHVFWISIYKQGCCLTSIEKNKFEHTSKGIMYKNRDSKYFYDANDTFVSFREDTGKIYNKDSSIKYDFDLFYVLPKYLKDDSAIDKYVLEKHATRDSLLKTVSGELFGAKKNL